MRSLAPTAPTMADLTAIISLKTCPECGAQAPIGDVVPHADTCSQEALCRLRPGAWPMEPGDEVVVITPVVLD